MERTTNTNISILTRQYDSDNRNYIYTLNSRQTPLQYSRKERTKIQGTLFLSILNKGCTGFHELVRALKVFLRSGGFNREGGSDVSRSHWLRIFFLSKSCLFPYKGNIYVLCASTIYDDGADTLSSSPSIFNLLLRHCCQYIAAFVIDFA